MSLIKNRELFGKSLKVAMIVILTLGNILVIYYKIINK